MFEREYCIGRISCFLLTCSSILRGNFFSVNSVKVVVLDTCGMSVAMPVAAPFPADLPTGFVVPWRRFFHRLYSFQNCKTKTCPRLYGAQPVVGQGMTMESAGLQAREISLFFSTF